MASSEEEHNSTLFIENLNPYISEVRVQVCSPACWHGPRKRALLPRTRQGLADDAVVPGGTCVKYSCAAVSVFGEAHGGLTT